MRFTPVETYTNILTIPHAKEHGSQKSVESYTVKLTPPSDNKKKTLQIVHSINNKTMKLKNQATTPPPKGKSKPKETGTNCRKPTRKNETGSGPELKAPPNSCAPPTPMRLQCLPTRNRNVSVPLPRAL
jgi:hypothetical protein